MSTSRKVTSTRGVAGKVQERRTPEFDARCSVVGDRVGQVGGDGGVTHLSRAKEFRRAFLLLELSTRTRNSNWICMSPPGQVSTAPSPRLAKVGSPPTRIDPVEARDADTTKSLLVEAAHGRGVVAVDGDRADPRWSCRHSDMLAALRREVEPFSLAGMSHLRCNADRSWDWPASAGTGRPVSGEPSGPCLCRGPCRRAEATPARRLQDPPSRRLMSAGGGRVRP